MSHETAHFTKLGDPDLFLTALKKRQATFYEEVRGCSLLSVVQRSVIAWSGLRVEDGSQNAIKVGGTDQEMLLLTCNETRSVLGLLKTYVTERDIAWDPLATNTSFDTLEACRLAREVLDDLCNNAVYRLQQRLAKAVEDALTTGAGYLWVRWDDMAGKESDADGVTLLHEGDIKFLAPRWEDVTYDPVALEFEDSDWYTVRERVSRWDLAATYMGMDEEIMALSNRMDDAHSLYLMRSEAYHDDTVYLTHFYHKKTKACPLGMYVAFSGDTVFEQRPLDDGQRVEPITLYRITAGNWYGTSFGWSPIFSLCGPQEALDAAMSAVVTICNTGGPKYWTEPNSPIGRGDLEGFGTVIQSPQKPERIDALALPPDLLNAIKLWVEAIQRYSGVNATSRGEPQASVKAARALAFIEQRTQQAASDLVKNYQFFCEAVATGVLLLLKHNQESERAVAVPGLNGRNVSKSYKPGAFGDLDRVRLVKGNADMQTLGGKLAVVQDMLEAGLIKDPSSYLQVMLTGNISKLIEVDDGQARIMEAENEALRDGQLPSEPLITDNHVRHALHHLALLDTPVGRESPTLSPAVLAHVTKHFELLQNPAGVMYMSLLYPNQPIPPMLLPQPGMQPEGMNPQNQGRPPQEGEVPQAQQGPPGAQQKLQAADDHAKNVESQAQEPPQPAA